MTQSAVSWKIKRLEERAGLELVKRGQEIEATPDGRDLLHYADRVIDAHDEAVEHLSRSDLEGVIRLGTNEDLRGGQLADVLADSAACTPTHPADVRVQLSGEVPEWIDEGAVDLAVVQIPADEVSPDDVELWQEPLRWVHGLDHEFPADEVVPVVSFGPGLVYLDSAEESLKRGGLRWRTVLECPMLSGVQAAIEAARRCAERTKPHRRDDRGHDDGTCRPSSRGDPHVRRRRHRGPRSFRDARHPLGDRT